MISGTPFFDLGIANGNDIGPAEGGLFDNNTQKWYFGRVLFGFDWRGEFGSFYPLAQIMIGWDGKDIKDRKNIFCGGFLGIDLLHPQERENLL